jgi:hypothetical protein
MAEWDTVQKIEVLAPSRSFFSSVLPLRRYTTSVCNRRKLMSVYNNQRECRNIRLRDGEWSVNSLWHIFDICFVCTFEMVVILLSPKRSLEEQRPWHGHGHGPITMILYIPASSCNSIIATWLLQLQPWILELTLWYLINYPWAWPCEPWS